jgi:AcrR family transcriptional regulator
MMGGAEDRQTSPLGLRERKKLKTRARIVEVARLFFSERGYDATTVAEIADAAEISVPTLFTYFRAKEDIFFSDYESAQALARQFVDDRPETQSALESLLEWGSRRRPKLIAHDAGWLASFTRILDANEALQGAEWVRLKRTRDHLAGEIARDLGVPADNLVPQLLAATAVVAITTVANVGRRHRGDAPNDDPYELIAYAQAVIGASTDALRQMPPARY